MLISVKKNWPILRLFVCLCVTWLLFGCYYGSFENIVGIISRIMYILGRIIGKTFEHSGRI